MIRVRLLLMASLAIVPAACSTSSGGGDSVSGTAEGPTGLQVCGPCPG